MTIVPTSIILQIVKGIYSIKNSTSSLLDKKGKAELEIAYTYLNESNASVELLRMALQHMETAYILLDKEPIVNAEKRINECNKLCYYIAKLHKELGDSYESTILYWVNRVNLNVYPPEEFKSILKASDWKSMESEYEWRSAIDNSYDPTEDPVWMAGDQHA